MREMLLAMVTDVRVVLIKLANRLAQHAHPLGPREPERREVAHKSPRDIFTPRLAGAGHGRSCAAIEDLAFALRRSVSYERVSAAWSRRARRARQFLAAWKHANGAVAHEHAGLSGASRLSILQR